MQVKYKALVTLTMLASLYAKLQFLHGLHQGS
jgi:hypothetical protein